MKRENYSKDELFGSVPVGEALRIMAVPTIISQMINLIYNMVDAFYIGRTGNAYMMGATTLTLTMVMMSVAISNLFGIGGGSQVARMMGAGRPEEAQRASAFSFWGAIAAAALYSALIGIFLTPILRFLGATDDTIGFASGYALIVIVIGGIPSLTSLVLAQLLRNAGYSGKASIGLSGGGILNAVLDPLFMFVLLPRGQEVIGAAIATALSNTLAFLYLLIAYIRAGKTSPLRISPSYVRQISRAGVKSILSVGVPSAILTAMFDVGNIFLNMLAAAHNDMVLAGIGIVMKVERIPNAFNMGLCQGMMPIVAYNYASGDHDRMREVIRTARKVGLTASGCAVVLFSVFASQAVRLFLSTSAGDAARALQTVTYAAVFLRIRCLASPVQFLNYSSSFCMQAMGDGKRTILHAVTRNILLYLPILFVFDRLFGEVGMAAGLPVSEVLSAFFAMWLLKRSIEQGRERLG